METVSMTEKPILVAVVSDLHAGSTLGLCPPEGASLDDGGVYMPSDLQKWLWNNWLDYWKQVSELATQHDADIWVVINGDALDGSHHGTTQIASGNITDQRGMVKSCLWPIRILQPKPRYKFMIRGTEAHVGQSAQDEEEVAEWFKCEPCETTGRHSTWERVVNANGTLISFKHHGKAGRIHRSKGSAINLLAQDIWAWAADDDHPVIPDLAIRSHVHQHADSGTNYRVRAITTPPWSFKNGYANKVVPEVALEVGGLTILCLPGGIHSVTAHKYKPKGPQVWTPKQELPTEQKMAVS